MKILLGLKVIQSALKIILIFFVSSAYPMEWDVVAELPLDGEIYRISGNNKKLEFGISEQNVTSAKQSTLAPKYTDQTLHVKPSSNERYLVVKNLENPNLEARFYLQPISKFLTDAQLSVAIKLHDLLEEWRAVGHNKKVYLLGEIEEIFQQWVKAPDTLNNDYLPFIPVFYVRLLFEYFQYEEAISTIELLDKYDEFIPIEEKIKLNYLIIKSLVELTRYKEAVKYIKVFNTLDFDNTSETKYLKDEIHATYGLVEILQGGLDRDYIKMAKGKKKIHEVISRTDPDDPKALAIYNSNLAVYYHLNIQSDKPSNNFEKQATKLYEKALELHSMSMSDRQVVHTLNNYALLKGAQKQPDVSLKLLRIIISLIGTKYPPEYNAVYYNNIASYYSELGLTKQALMYYQLAIEQWESSAYEQYALGAKISLSKILRAIGKNNEAHALLKNVLPSVKILNSLNKIRLYIELSYQYLQKNDFVIAGRYALLATQLNGVGIKDETRIDLELLLLELDYHQRNYEAFGKKANIFISNLKSSNKYLTQTLHIINLKAKWHIANQQLKEAKELLDFAIEQISDLSDRVNATNTGVMWRDKVNEIIIFYLNLLNIEKTAENKTFVISQMFNIWDKFNGASIILNRKNINRTNYSEDILLLKEKIWQREIKLLKKHEKVTLQEQVETDLLSKKVEDELIVTETIPKSSHLLSLEKVQLLLKPKEAVLGYHLGKKSGYLIYIDKMDADFLPIPNSAGLRESIKNIVDNIQKPNFGVLENLKELELLAGINKLNLSNKNRIIFVSNDSTQLLPLDLMFHHKNKKQIEIINTFSVGHYFTTSQNLIENNKEIVIFADPDFDRNISSKFKELGNDEKNYLVRLPWSYQEAVWIRDLFPSLTVEFIGKYATSQNLLSSKTRNAKLQHIATHSINNPKYPDIIGLATSGPDTNSDSNFNFVSLSRISSFATTSDLVVLSGCETMLGEVAQGEGHLSLSRTLLSMGAGGTIATLWPVADKPTAIFMKYFYRGLKSNNGNIAKSLFSAKRRLSTETRYKHPRYWAPFIYTSANNEYTKINLN